MTDYQLSSIRDLRQAIISRRAAETAFVADPTSRTRSRVLADADIMLRESENLFLEAFKSGVPAARKATV